MVNDSDFVWFSKSSEGNTDDLYQIRWYNKDGKQRMEFFTTQKRAKIIWGDICGELSWVHIWLKPEMGLRAYLQHLPLDLVEIVKI
jgi:hypothetical protein